MVQFYEMQYWKIELPEHFIINYIIIELLKLELFILSSKLYNNISY